MLMVTLMATGSSTVPVLSISTLLVVMAVVVVSIAVPVVDDWRL